MKPLSVFLLGLVLTLVQFTPAAAGTLAVFPLLDLSQDENGVNFSLTDYLRQKAVEHGFTVLPHREVMDFMVRHRIRSLGMLTEHQLELLRQELKAEYALLGTVCQLDQKPAARLSLSLQLVRTADEEVVWSLIKDLHEADLITLLAISNPQSLNDLYERYFKTLFDTIPADIRKATAVPPAVGILSVNMPKSHVKPGEKMEGAIRVYISGPGGKPPAFSLLIAGKEYPVEADDTARLLKATWLAQDRDGTYPVDLVAQFPSGPRQVQRIGEYTVDGIAPQLAVHFRGVTRDAEPYFTKDLSILTQLKVPEALSRWDVAVYDEDQELVLRQNGAGQIPPRIFWNGTVSATEEAEDGRYTIRVQVWDLAENMASFEGHANLMRTPPKLKLTVQRKEADVHVQLDNEVQSPLAFWFVKVYEKHGGLLVSRTGETLPASLDVKLKQPDSTEPLELVFAGQDRYGNRTWQKVDDLLNMEVKKTESKIVPETQWLENF